MTPRELFSILLKMTGIFLLKDAILAFTSVLPIMTGAFYGYDSGFEWMTLLTPIIFMVIYAWIVYLFIFRTQWLIEKFRLTEDFAGSIFEFNMHRSTILSISFIVAGIFTLINVLPHFIKETIAFFQSRKPTGLLDMEEGFTSTYFFLYLGELILAVIMIIYQRQFVNFIESRRKQ